MMHCFRINYRNYSIITLLSAMVGEFFQQMPDNCIVPAREPLLHVIKKNLFHLWH